MKFSILTLFLASAVFIQAEFMDLSPILTLIGDAPLLAVFIWVFMQQQRQNERLIRAIIQLSGKKPKDDEVE